MKDIAIFGAGGFGREVACLINLVNKEKPTWNFIGFFDDNPNQKGTYNEYGKIFGGVDVLNEWKKPLGVLLAIGNGSTTKKIVERINNPLVDYPNFLFHTTFSDQDSVKMGRGNIMTSGHFSCAVEIGSFNVMNGDTVFGHDDKIGNFNSFMPGVRVSGEVIIGDECLFGVNSIVLQQIKIGNNVHLGAGSVLMTKPKDGGTYIGNPAKRFKF